MEEQTTRAGFVAVLGAPNAGKSTLVNRMVGTKVSIVSPKVQTTRTRVLGIHMSGASQVVLVDTPGIFNPNRRLDRAMVNAAWTGAKDADMVLLLIDAEKGIGGNTETILKGLADEPRPAICAINKVDQVAKPKLLGLAQELAGRDLFEEIFMISALDGTGVDDLSRHLETAIPEGPWLYPEDEVSDLPLRQLAAEITREKLYLQLHQELPYQAAVETESWETDKKGDPVVRQVILVERPSQRSIVLGKQGRRIKAIGQAAREELEELLEGRVHLFLHVTVRENWSNDREHFSDWGLDYDA